MDGYLFGLLSLGGASILLFMAVKLYARYRGGRHENQQDLPLDKPH